MEHGFGAVGRKLEDRSAFAVSEGAVEGVVAVKSRAVEIARAVSDDAAHRGKAIVAALEGIKDLFLAVPRKLEHGSAAACTAPAVFRCAVEIAFLVRQQGRNGSRAVGSGEGVHHGERAVRQDVEDGARAPDAG